MSISFVFRFLRPGLKPSARIIGPCLALMAFACHMAGAAPAAEPLEELTLPDALTLALSENPALKAFAWDVRAADALVEQAGLRPNPELSVEIEGVRWSPGPAETTRSTSLSGAIESGALAGPAIGWEREKGSGARSGFSEAEVTISIAQSIELGRKRAKRVALARHEKELALWDYQAARADVLAQTAAAFVDVLAAQERVALEEELVGLAREIVRTFSLLTKAGRVSPLELSRAEVELATTEIAHEESMRELDAARALLASAWGGKSPDFTRVAGRLDDIESLPALANLEARLKDNPDLARWSAEMAAREAAFSLERAQRIPDVTAEFGFRSGGLADSTAQTFSADSTGGFGFTRSRTEYDADRDNSLVLGFSLPLPLFDRNQGNIKAAAAMIAKTGEERRGAEAAAHAQLAAAHHAATGAYRMTRALREDVMPKLGDTFEKVQRGYQQGKFSYLDVLDTQRTLFEARESFLHALTRYHKNVIQMERVTGQALKHQKHPYQNGIEDADDEE